MTIHEPVAPAPLRRPKVSVVVVCFNQAQFLCEAIKSVLAQTEPPHEIILIARGFKERLRACEDYDLYLRLVREHSVQAYPGVVAEYRHHDHNMSRDYAFMLRSVLGVLKEELRAIHDQK
jgi:hypothetical protein